MSSTAVPELSNELAQHNLQRRVGPVGSLAQTHALSSHPKADPSKANAFYSSFYELLGHLWQAYKADGNKYS